MQTFEMNGDRWTIIFVDPTNGMLVDRTKNLTVATTDPSTRTVYVSNELSGPFLTRVIVHELGHCAMISYGLLDDVHRVVKRRYWVQAEEWVCNFLMDYGLMIFSIASEIIGVDVVTFVSKLMNRIIF